MNLGKKIKELRLNKSVTQEQLAEKLRVTPQAVSKWENNVTLPDIQLLPELSVFFGVTIDELFDMDIDAHFNRITAMIQDQKLLSWEDFKYAEGFLKDMISDNGRKGDALTLLAELYNHMAEEYCQLAEYYAKEALIIEPTKKDNHTALLDAQQGTIPDWNYSNRHARIEYYKDFVKENPDHFAGYMWLMDELIADNRLQEAEETLKNLEAFKKDFRIDNYRGMIEWGKGDQTSARSTWSAMAETYKDDWMAQFTMADSLSHISEYDEAIKYYEIAAKLQPAPRYTDAYMSIAHIYEIQGKHSLAIEAWQKVIDILKNDWHITEGETIASPIREIQRLRNKMDK